MDLDQLFRDLKAALRWQSDSESLGVPPSDAEVWQRFGPLLNQTAVTFLNASSSDRVAIRAFFAERDVLGNFCHEFARQAASDLRATGAPEDLRRGLAAVSIENIASDYRDTLIALADLHVSAVDGGLDPRPHFLAVAALSGTRKPTGGQTPMSELLTEFGPDYAVVEEEQGLRKHWTQQLREGTTVEELVKEAGWPRLSDTTLSAVTGLSLDQVRERIRQCGGVSSGTDK